MNTIKLRYIVCFCLIILSNIKIHAQAYRWDVQALIGSVEFGSAVIDPMFKYYDVYHSGYSSSEALAKSKEAKLLLIAKETSPQVDATKSLDSILQRRAKVHLLDEADKSSVVGSFFAVERDRLVKLLNKIKKNVEKIPAADYGGSATLKHDWDMRCQSIDNGIEVADSYRMTAINRKKIYVSLYNDALKYNDELNKILGYLMSVKQMEKMVKASPVRKIDKTTYITYGRSRWIVACKASMSKKKSN